jgi:hypothetical protein
MTEWLLNRGYRESRDYRGYREGGAADAAQNIYGECRQAGMKSPYESKTHLPPSPGGHYRCKAQMRLTDET